MENKNRVEQYDFDANYYDIVERLIEYTISKGHKGGDIIHVSTGTVVVLPK